MNVDMKAVKCAESVVQRTSGNIVTAWERINIQTLSCVYAWV